MENVTSNGEGSAPKYWLSLDQWRKDPQFKELAEKEFQSSPLSEEDGKDGWARREFLKLMGASLALTSFGCVRRPAQKIVPYAKKPLDVQHGVSSFYTSTFTDGSEGFGVLVAAREGRPIKIEGNADHPLNEGGMSARAHAHILSLYDPERLNGPRKNLLNDKKSNFETVSVNYETLDKAVSEQFKKGGVAVLSSSLNSPSTLKLLGEFTKSVNAKVYHWDHLSYDEIKEGQRLSYGKAVMPRYRLDQARYILAIENDFLGTYLSPTSQARDFAKARKPGKDMSKLVVFESLLTLTGTNADERYRIRSSQALDVVMALLNEIVVRKKLSRYAGDTSVQSILEKFSGLKLGLPDGRIEEIAQSLWDNRGQSLVLAGGWAQSENGLALQVAVNFMNSILENDGKTVVGSGALLGGLQGSYEQVNELMTALDKGQIKSLIIHGVNPAYVLGERFKAAAQKAEMIVYTGDRIDETGALSDYIVPDHHPLEGWSDAELVEGVYSIQQPTIRPMYDSRGFQDSLLSWAKLAGSSSLKNVESWYDYLRGEWQGYYRSYGAKAGASFEDFWIQRLHEGALVTGGDIRRGGAARSFNTAALKEIKPTQEAQGYELSLYATVGLRDGSMANVSWLQEFPDPVTKICWDNYLCMSPKDAASLKAQEGDMVSLSAHGQTLQLPVHIQPGQADGVLGLAVGYGRTRAGKVANGVGANAYTFAQWKEGRLLASGLAVSELKKLKGRYELACTQGHHSMEGRQIVVEAALADYMKDQAAGIHKHKIFTMWSEHKYPNNKWGMVIDLNTCTGCSACVIACQSENSIPTVGKRHVLRGREMHWIRIDRYYVGEPEDPSVVHQPIVCMHCDNAPCETVCPVMATVHSDEGTNDMIYNRCVGTRYCSNNCPYKVRRFNWFDFTKVEKPLTYAMNPDVTVRDRGVMEKCTFCIHRIRAVKSEAKLHDRQLKDGDIKTACQQSCPTNAIVFGDLNDENSMVSKLFSEKNAYALLEELNAKPSVRYQTKIRHTEHMKGQHGHGHGEHGKGGHA